MRYTIFLLVSITLLLSTAPSYSHIGGNVEVEIVSDRGEEFFVIPYKDTHKGRTHIVKKYLEAKKGGNYNIVIRNNTARKIGAVIAVDGRNIITGKKSFLKNNEQMYIVEPYGYTTLKGWRTDQNTVHSFYFTDKNDSYTVKTFGDSSAMGVIAIAVFPEKKKTGFLLDRKMQKEDRSRVPAAPSAGSKSRSYEESDTAGTGFGNKKYSHAEKVYFEPENTPSERIFVKYEWHDVLCGKGILKCIPEGRNRFWDEDDYAPYPPGYRTR